MSIFNKPGWIQWLQEMIRRQKAKKAAREAQQQN